MKNILLILIFLPMVGYTSFFYTPNSHNVPVFEKKGQLKLNSTLDNQADHIQFEVQGAYSFHRHWSAMINSSFIETRAQTTNRFGKSIFAELGAGYFTKVS